ncbi:MAG: sugar phosphate isomerase/epimerase [Kiritimatiellae bacterium]|nr:sugar phosphate isomerase/epimerase [Kiritimatiellia bacterium]
MSRFKDNFEIGLQTWSLGHYPDHDYILQACEDLGIRHVDIGNCHFEFVGNRPSAKVIDNHLRWLNTHTADGLNVRYEGERNFPGGSFLIPCIRETHFRGAGDQGEIVFGYQQTDYASLAARYREKGITIDTFGPGGLPWRADDGEQEARRIFEFGKTTGAGFIELHTIKEPQVRALEALQEEYGIKVAIHNHGKRHEFGKIEQLKPFFEKTSFSFSLDTAWAVDAGEDPLDMVRAFGDRLLCVHCKEFEYEPDGSYHGVVSGSGAFDLPGLIKLLDQSGYDGLLALEYEGFERDSITPLWQSKATVEALVAAL